MKDEEDDEEVKVSTVPPLLFPRSLIATSHSHLVPTNVHILGSGQFRQPMVMTSVTVATKPAAQPTPQSLGQPTTLAPSGCTKPSVDTTVPEKVVPEVAMGLPEGVV